MARVFQIASGKYAIWDGEQDNLPFTDPLNNLGRVIDHSDLQKVRIIDVRSFTLNVPAIPTSGSGQGSGGGRRGSKAQSYTLGAHGRPGQPFILGQINVNGVNVAFTGSVPVQQNANDSYARFLSLGCDTSNIYVHEYSVQNGNAGTQVWSARPAQTFNVTCYITDILF